MAVLVTGGFGYIGSHITKIIEDEVIVLDNLSNSNLDYKNIFPNLNVYIDDLTYESSSKIFQKHNIKSVIHLAGSKSVDASIKKPLIYYHNNVIASVELLRSMIDHNINNLLFSSSATVYGNEHKSPLNENMSCSYLNPYGHTKIIIEEIIRECCKSYQNFKAVSLRYFNPIGAHFDGKLGDKPLGKAQNIMPLIIEAAKGGILKVFGNDYPTKDGTCVRDYLHVLDLADAHIKGLNFLSNSKDKYEVFNIGLGMGISVLELIDIFQETNQIFFDYKISSRRKGDSAISFADNSRALSTLKWEPKYNYKDMCRDSWNSSK